MTVRLDRMDSLDALYLTAKAYPGGVVALAQRMGVPVSTLYKKLERDTQSHHLRWSEGEDIIHFAKQSRVPDPFLALRALAWRFGHLCIPIPDADSKPQSELAAMVVRVFEEGADVSRAISQACADRRIEAAERVEIEREIEEVMTALAALLQRVRQEAAR